MIPASEPVIPASEPVIPASEPVIRVRGLVTRFGNQTVHDGLDLDVRRGEVLGVVGGSGTGKSVLLKTIIGLNRPAAGRIEVLGDDTAELDDAGRIRLQARWGVLFQDGALFSSMTVAQNIMVPLKEHTGLDPLTIAEVARIKIAMTGLPPSAGAKYPSELSGGMRKRAGLARALALDPEILFLDEPTAGLDPIGAAAFDELIGNLQRSLGLTVFMVTHDLDSLRAICDRIAVLIDRRIVVDTLDALRLLDHPWIRDYFNGPRGRAALDAGAGTPSKEA
ncbi:ABC transporter ATP-binding protein [Skermanella mucosa]|uniref:ABC transporter ATP-binding protein n=1 Tax=Skermanella mucosa TaxID=1789672 RepID=UPI001E39E688|nr:ABC transporter ATP-binding protein [Skermanella mucosa]UEM19556.1 ABC transporter ATP-binding protein [Skermanella mucosa]